MKFSYIFLWKNFENQNSSFSFYWHTSFTGLSVLGYCFDFKIVLLDMSSFIEILIISFSLTILISYACVVFFNSSKTCSVYKFKPNKKPIQTILQTREWPHLCIFLFFSRLPYTLPFLLMFWHRFESLQPWIRVLKNYHSTSLTDKEGSKKITISWEV